MQIVAYALLSVLGIVIVFVFVGSQTIDSYEPPKPQPEPKPKLPEARVHRR